MFWEASKNHCFSKSDWVLLQETDETPENSDFLKTFYEIFRVAYKLGKK